MVMQIKLVVVVVVAATYISFHYEWSPSRHATE